MKRKNIEAWLSQHGFIKGESYEVSFAGKVYYDYYKKKENDRTFMYILETDSIFFGYNKTYSYNPEKITKSFLEQKLKDYDNHVEPTFKMRKYF